MHSDIDYLIVGSGIIGCSCALLLSRFTDAKVTLIGDIQVPEKAQRTYAMNRVSEHLLFEAGIWQHLAPHPYTCMEVFDLETSGRLRYSSDAHNEPNLGHMVTDRQLACVLRDILQAHTQITWIQSRVATMKNNEGSISHQSVLLEDGSEVTGRLIIAADGKHSCMASLCNFPIEHLKTGDTSIVCRIQLEKVHDNCARQWFSRQGIVALLPLEDQHTASLVWSINEHHATRLIEADKGVFERALTHATLGKLGKLIVSSPRIHFPVSQHRMSPCYRPGLVFIGDAAHSVHPLAGQGLNMGLHDCLVLLQHLINSYRNHNVDNELPLFHYQQERLASTIKDVGLMKLLQRSFRSSNILTQYGRQSAMQMFDRIPALSRQAVQSALYSGMNPDTLRSAIQALHAPLPHTMPI